MEKLIFVKWIMESNFRRWVLFFPFSVICTLIASILWMLLTKISLGRILISSESFSYNLYFMPTSGLIAGYVFIYTGGYVAPHYKITLLLFGVHFLYCVLAIYNYAFRFNSPDYWMIVYFFSCLVSSIIALDNLKIQFKK